MASIAQRVRQAVRPKRWARRRSGRSQAPFGSTAQDDASAVDLKRRRDQLSARVAELQWDLGGLVYEMASRDRIRVEVIVQRAAMLQTVDAELGEVQRILRLEQNATAGECASCGAPHSVGAAYCWQCGQALLEVVAGDTIVAP